MDGILFRPLPFRDAGRLIAVWQTYPHWKKDPILRRTWDKISFSIPEYRDWQAGQQSFSAVGIRSGDGMMLNDGASHELVQISLAILGFLGIVSVVASLLPARRAGRVEPAVVLRGE